eukprot:comp22305_c0_seq1/m.33111 comp22305_c0_seq1/g.33111  ORF comp22305_c0_seq1/g.33111 comp22305_c0_seq1/m.33111 type:complete len:668 (-) comp22305_c0_seq1:89-2092(-)
MDPSHATDSLSSSEGPHHEGASLGMNEKETAVKIPADIAAMRPQSTVSHVEKKRQMQVTFKDVHMEVSVGKGKKATKKTILDKVNGVFQPARLTVILGPSGAGKTSLLNVLAGEIKQKTVGGEIRVNDQKVEGRGMKKLSGFVFQDDVIMYTMTVKEAITFSANLRLPSTVAQEEKDQAVADVISLLHLEKCQDTIIGNTQVKGVSGGERKRVAIAMEMVTNPAILFLDEPTSGLDTYTAYSVVHTLKALAHTGRTVVATLHQPSSEIFHMFDDLCLLANGRVMYMGRADKCVDYFASLGYQCPQYTNPADYFFMEVLNISNIMNHSTVNAIEAPAVSSEKLKGDESNLVRAKRLLDTWEESSLGKSIAAEAADPSLTHGVDKTELKGRATFPNQFAILFRRAAKNAWRNKMIIRVKLVQYLSMAVLVGLIYWQVGTSQESIQNRQGALFFVCLNGFMSSAMPVVSIFFEEKQVFKREYGSRYYGMLPYYISKLMVEFPFIILYVFIGCCISYWMIGFQAVASKFLIYCLTLIILNLAGAALGILAASTFPSIQAAMAVLPMAIMPLMLFSGFYVQSNSVPVYFTWIQWLSPIKYSFQALALNEFDGLVLPCPPNSPRCISSGDYVIEMLAFNSMSISVCIAVLFALLCSTVILGAVALYFTVCRRR